MASSSNDLKDRFPLCLDRLNTISLRYPVLSFCPFYIPFSEACVWLETRDPHPQWQWLCDTERPGLEYRVWGSRCGRKSAGQIRAWHPVCQNSYRAHHHPRYYFHHPTLSIHTHQLQCTKASTVTRKAIFWLLLGACSELANWYGCHLSLSIAWWRCTVCTILIVLGNKVDPYDVLST